jgi:lipid II:glycine glycyltransferase (peptidoglycan interpeptide bridge formation enzyme)
MSHPNHWLVNWNDVEYAINISKLGDHKPELIAIYLLDSLSQGVVSGYFYKYIEILPPKYIDYICSEANEHFFDELTKYHEKKSVLNFLRNSYKLYEKVFSQIAIIDIVKLHKKHLKDSDLKEIDPDRYAPHVREIIRTIF